MRLFEDKTVILGVTGGIAAYKIATLASMLVQAGANVHVILTENGSKFITPHTFEALTHNKCMMDTFDRNHSYDVEHVELAKIADVIVVAPATANTIAKMAYGFGDNLLLTTILAAKCPILLAPAMNTNMYDNIILQENLSRLRNVGMKIIEPQCGYLACGDTGFGKMVEPQDLFEEIAQEIAWEKDLLGKKVLVTAGATREAIDPVRFISNHSTGKMGYGIAKAARLRGADVTLVSGVSQLKPPHGVEFIGVESADEMYNAVMGIFLEFDYIIKSAAVADYTTSEPAYGKIKKSDPQMSLELVKTKDILQAIGDNRRGEQVICGFAMETEELESNATKKLHKKHLDVVIANSLCVDGAGFGSDTNIVSVLTHKTQYQLPLMSKEELGHKILDVIKGLE